MRQNSIRMIKAAGAEPVLSAQASYFFLRKKAAFDDEHIDASVI